MIVRVFRARVRPGKKAEFEQTVRQHSIPLVEAQKGLITYEGQKKPVWQVVHDHYARVPLYAP